jgi:hypothetical protein
VINQPGQLSPDGATYWNGTAWLSTLAPDSRTRWNGTDWGQVAPLVRPGHKLRNAGIVVGGLIVLFVAVGIANSGSSGTSTPAAADKPTTATAATAAPVVAAAKPAVVAAAKPAPPTETTGQANARRSAQQYLSFAPFSRAGLIDQLSSSAVGFSVADATYGVDAQHADWNAQAALSAKQYLRISPFSRAGLIDQLSSSAVGFTYDQAVFGVTAAGL